VDKIIIADLRLRGIVGVNPEERTQAQDISLWITLHTDLRAAGSSDDLAETVDYSALEREIRALVEGSRFLLVERLAHETARLCLRHPGVERAVVRLEKPRALPFARAAVVEIERTRADYPVASPGQPN
jgi:FolB domain-containing protein